jgi:acetylornithine deacetylase/succinyl-diaminopimelate desuccinylase-like protein
MSASVLSPAPRGLASPSNGRRILFVPGVALVFGALNSLPATAPTVEVTIAHAVVVGITVVLALALARSEMQRQALDTRLNLLQAQVAPPAGLTLFEFGKRLDAPIIILPLANHDNTQHAENENIRLQNLWDAMRIYGAVLAGCGEPGALN